MTTRNITLEPEDVVLRNAYCFTVSPSDKHQHYKYNSSTRVNEFMKDWTEKLEKLFKVSTIKVKLRLEISKAGRLHFHGWITYRTDEDIRMFYLTIFNKLTEMCTIDIHEFTALKANGDEFDSKYKTWKEYVNKQSLFKKYIKINIDMISDTV